MVAATETAQKILVLATISCAYPGADTVGQAHLSYPSNVYVMRVPAPVLFPEEFYLRCFDKGIGGIIIMACGTDCPYEGAYQRLAQRIDGLYPVMRARGIDPRRIRLTSICTVCSGAFLKEVNQMNNLLQQLGTSESGAVGLGTPQAHPEGKISSLDAPAMGAA